jgi:hypothetical protein
MGLARFFIGCAFVIVSFALEVVRKWRLDYMWQNYVFGMHWKHQGKMYYDELSAESQDDAAGYFIDHMRDDVALVRVELVRPDDGGVREFATSPVSPFAPMKARRRMEADEDAP